MATFWINFNKAALEKTEIPERGKNHHYKDTREKGLEMIVTSTGNKGFYLYRKMQGRAERLFLGRFPDLTVEQARKLALQNKGKIAQGINPIQEKRKIQNECTFGHLFNDYMERYSKVYKRSWQYDEREVKAFLPHWTNRKISSITRDEIARLHSKIGQENGIYAANRLLERIRAIFNKAIEWGWEGKNPASGITKFKEKCRDRYLTGDEMPNFLQSLDAEENETVRDFFKVLLFTGVRKSNGLKMRWDEISFVERVWRIPETKNGDPLIIPLSDLVIEILDRRRLTEKSAWVFSGEAKEGYLKDPKRAWNRILKRAGINSLRIHDLRRTFGSWQASMNTSLFIIGRTLGHKSHQSTQVYARMNLDPVRMAVNNAVTAMSQTLLMPKQNPLSAQKQ